MGVVDARIDRPVDEKPPWKVGGAVFLASAVIFASAVLVIAVLSFGALAIFGLMVPGVASRLVGLVALASFTCSTFAVATRRRRSSAYAFVWLVPYLVLVWAGWSAASWAERYEYESTCSYWWENRHIAGWLGESNAALAAQGRHVFMQGCMAQEREREDRALADPEAECRWMEDMSGCPPSPDLRFPWLCASAIAGAGGVAWTAWPRRKQKSTMWAGGT
jgi:hypothetical protein